MDKELILQQEAANDGQTIHLYFDEMVGLYLAFGLSAYYTDMVTDPILSYSESLGKPVALLGKQQVLYLRQGLTKEKHQRSTYYRFRMRQPVGEAGYKRWLARVKK